MANTLVVSPVVGPTPWSTPTLTATRPRIFAYPATRLTRAQGYWTSPPSNMTTLKSQWASVAPGVDSYAISQSLTYMLGGNNPTNVTNAFNAVNGETFTVSGSGNTRPQINCPVETPYVLDWCYGGLSTGPSGQRQTLINQCEAFANAAEALFTGTGSLEIADFWTNNGVAVYTMCILAAEGETGFTSRIAKLRNVLQHMQLWYDEIGGDGFRFQYPHQVDFNAMGYFAYHIAANEEALLPGRVGYLNTANDLTVRRLNSTGQSYLAWTCDTYLNSGGYASALPCRPAWSAASFADVYQNPVHAWTTAQQLASQPNKWTAFGNQPISDGSWPAFFFYNAAQTQQSPAAAGYPLCKAFPISGVANMRATWPNGVGVNSWFFSQPCPTDNHTTPQGNSFFIWRNDDPLISHGYSYAGRPSGWENDPTNGAAIATTVGNYSMCKSSGPLFVPSGATKTHRAGSQLTTASGSQPVGSSGTYPWSWALQNNRGVGTFLNSSQVRFVDNTGTGTPECNVVGDATNAYSNTTQISKYLRYFSYVPGIGGTGTTGQGTYVIRDKFTAVGGMSTVLVPFWGKTKPTISGQTVIQGTSAAGVIKCTGNKAVIVSTSGLSQATIQMLSPTPGNVWLVGGGNGIAGAPAGPGYESFFDFDPFTGLGGSNLDYSTNTQLGPSDQRVINAYAWIKGQWRLEYQTDAATSAGSIVFIITVDAAGGSSPTWTLSDAQAMAPEAFIDVGPPTPPPPQPGTPLGLAFENSLGRTLYVLKGANMNTTADQQMVPIANPTLSAIADIYVTNPSTSLTNAVGGFYSGAGKTGLHLVASTQVYSSLTAAGKLLSTTLGSDATTNVITTAPYFALTTPQGSTATADIYLLGSDLNAVDATGGAPPLNPNGAQFITSSITSVSSLDTGRMGYITAWGGNEFGYAFTYALSGAPAGLTIDSDIGMLSISSPLAVGNYTFNIVATNRENTAVSNSLPYTLTVLAAITVGTPSSSQVLHKTYDPHSGAWGAPSGNDWTTVFATMVAAIISDQTAASAGALRATWLTRAATTYQYTNNKFWTGVQYLSVQLDPAHNVGATPIFQNIRSDPGQGQPYDDGPLNFGAQDAGGNVVGAMNHLGTSIKGFCAKLATVAAGATSVTLLNGGDATKIKAGRWHAVVGTCIQLGGFPPNVMFIDYVMPLVVSGTTVTLDRPLKYAYDQTWWEDSTSDVNFGLAWLVPFDMGGTGGPSPSDPRAILRGTISNINFLTNPNAAGADISFASNCIDLQFVGCQIPDLQATMSKHVALTNCTLTSQSEADKQSETLFFDNVTAGTFFAASGFQYFLARNSRFINTGGVDTCQISPRQFRALTTTFDATASFTPPFTLNFQGPNWYQDFENCTFKGTNASGWTFAGNPFSPLTIGTDAVWSGSQLQIPSSFANFESWLINSYAGGIVAVSGLGPITANWGYISSVSSDGAGTKLYLNITWVNGTKPTSGTIDIVAARTRRLLMNNPTFTVGYANAKFAKQTVTGQTSWGFPVGLPPPYNE